jgi:hypothetical protein
MHVIGKLFRRACGQSEERFKQIREIVQIAHAFMLLFLDTEYTCGAA